MITEANEVAKASHQHQLANLAVEHVVAEVHASSQKLSIAKANENSKVDLVMSAHIKDSNPQTPSTETSDTWYMSPPLPSQPRIHPTQPKLFNSIA